MLHEENELLCRLALTLVPGVGDVHARLLVQHCGSARSIFRERKKVLQKIEGIGTARADAILNFRDFALAESELRFIQKNDIRILFLTDDDYPQRLLHCVDPPAVLFYKGGADLNSAKIIAIVGTRMPTEYGKNITEKLLGELSASGVLVVSGLAFGIDALAHRYALRNKLPTVAVVAHGLDKMYPFQHTALAKEMLAEGGGLLSEFFSGTLPERHHFPLRNRVVAGMSDATVVIETAIKGGSMITAKLADSYNRDVFAVPGRAIDKLSSGCNYLIRKNRAAMIESAADLLEVMGWAEQGIPETRQRSLFVTLSEPEQKLVNLLQCKESVHVDDLYNSSGLSGSAAAAALLNLELQGIVGSLPGKRYQLL